MKTKRRQELRTNELIRQLEELWSFIYVRWRWVAAVTAAIVVAAGCLWYWQSSRKARREEGLKAIASVREEVDPTARVERLQRIAQEYADGHVVQAALERIARTAAEALMSVPATPAEQDKRARLLEAQENAYRRLLSGFGDKPQTAALARLGLAAVMENRGRFEEARQHYKAVLEDPRLVAAGAYRVLAERNNATLDARMHTIEVLPALPKTQPTTQATTGPAATAPVP